MKMNEQEREYNINISSSCSDQIKFVYRKGIDKPENHRMHINKFFEFYIFIDGEANYIVKDMLFSLKSGDIVIITPYEVHKALLKKEGMYERFYFLIPIDAFKYMKDDPLKNILEKIKVHKNLVSLDEKQRKKAVELLFQIRELCIDRGNQNLTAYSFFLEFIDIINNSFSQDDPILAGRTQQFPDILSKILRYIDENLTDICTANEIAAKFHISAPYLSSIFKKYTNIGIKKYIQLRKISYAKSLLDTGRNVTEACYESGFNGCSYFIKMFKEQTGLTPHEYLKSGSINTDHGKKDVFVSTSRI